MYLTSLREVEIGLAPGPNRTQRSWVDLASLGRNSSKDEFDSYQI
jgi:hypothetical protein